MRLFLVLLMVFIGIPFLEAKTDYIKITTTSDIQRLKAIKKKFTSLGLNLIYRKSGHAYGVYCGPYSSKKDLRKSYKKVIRYFPHAQIIGVQKVSHQPHISQKIVRKKESKYEENYYFSLALNYSSAPSSHTILQGSVKVLEPKDTGINFVLESGIDLQYNFSAGIGVSYLNTGDLAFKNLYGIVNYKFKIYRSYQPYFGVLIGYSSLAWSSDPIENPSKNSNNDSTSPYYGTQVGLLYKGLSYGDIFVGYQCLFMQHTTSLQIDTTNRSKLEHNMLHSIGIGFKYNF